MEGMTKNQKAFKVVLRETLCFSAIDKVWKKIRHKIWMYIFLSCNRYHIKLICYVRVSAEGKV